MALLSAAGCEVLSCCRLKGSTWWWDTGLCYGCAGADLLGNGAPTWLSAPRQTAGWGGGLSLHGWQAMSLLTPHAVPFCTCKRLIMSSTSWQLTSCVKITTSQVPKRSVLFFFSDYSLPPWPRMNLKGTKRLLFGHHSSNIFSRLLIPSTSCPINTR